MEFEALQKIIAEVLNVDPDEITLETTFVDDLGADSLDIFQIIMGIEEEFDIEIPQEDAEKIIALARANSVTPIQTMPWAEKRDPDHQKGMYDIYNTLSEKYGVKLTVAGNVFEDVFYNYPEIDMYYEDGEHASPYGSYTIAMAAYAAIFGESVKGLSPDSYCTYKPGFEVVNDKAETPFPLDAEKAAKLQELVDKFEFGK